MRIIRHVYRQQSPWTEVTAAASGSREAMKVEGDILIAPGASIVRRSSSRRVQRPVMLFDEVSEIPDIFYPTISPVMSLSFKTLAVLALAAVSVIAETHTVYFQNESVQATIISKGHH